MNVFDIIGPVMIGPSSSHTAGAVRIGRTSAKILGEKPSSAKILLSGSFAETYRGHGTDKAIVAGILGMKPDDERIPDSFQAASEQGLVFEFVKTSLPRAHPNTAKLFLTGESGRQCTVQGASVGGGNILITGVNERETAFTGDSDTLIIAHDDKPGMIASVTSYLSARGVNIGNFRLHRPRKGLEAVMTLEVDGALEKRDVEELKRFPHITGIVYLRAYHSEG